MSCSTCRRRFLQIGLASAAAIACGPTGVQPSPLGDVQAGNVSALSVGSLEGVGNEPLAIGRDDKGVYAMTLTCTHAGCRAQVAGHEIACGCHGSTFDANGNVTGGPAPAPLEHYAVTADASGNLTIHTGSVVDAGTRLSV